MEYQATMTLNTLTPAEQRLLQRVADCDVTFRRSDIHGPAECERCDAEVRELQKLEGRGWVTLRWNHMCRHGEVYAASPFISDAGREVLAECAVAAM